MSDASPYSPPIAGSPATSIATEKSWIIQDGDLWVKDGAELPGVCLYGSKRMWKRPLKLWLLSGVGRKLTFLLVGMVAMGQFLFFLWRSDADAMLTFAAFIVSILAFHAIRETITTKIRIHGGVGVGILTRLAPIILIDAIAILALSLVGDRIIHMAGSGIRVAYPTIFCIAALQRVMIDRMLVHSVEKKGDWFRLANVHPRAVVELLQIQDGVPDRAGNSGT